MQVMMFTNNSDRVRTRRFFVNRTMSCLIKMLEREADRLFHAELSNDMRLCDYYDYTRRRIASLDLSKSTEFIDKVILETQLLDYWDVLFFRSITGDKTRLMFRMFKYSEPLLIDKLDEKEKVSEKKFRYLKDKVEKCQKLFNI